MLDLYEEIGNIFQVTTLNHSVDHFENGEDILKWLSVTGHATQWGIRLKPINNRIQGGSNALEGSLYLCCRDRRSLFKQFQSNHDIG